MHPMKVLILWTKLAARWKQMMLVMGNIAAISLVRPPSCHHHLSHHQICSLDQCLSNSLERTCLGVETVDGVTVIFL